MRILVVEDEATVLAILAEHLLEAGFEVEARTSGEEGLEEALGGRYDMILMDIGLPGMSGFDVVSSLRAEGNSTPVIMLTALGAEDDIVRGLDVGADGYVTKPYSPRELLARIKALKRREELADNTVLSFGDLVIDQAAQEVTRGGASLLLTGTEIKLLSTLVKADGRILSKADLLEKIWGIDFDPQTPMVEVHVANLRKKLKAAGPPLIRTVRGQGYCVSEETDG